MFSIGRWTSVSGCKLLGHFVQLSDSVSLFHLSWLSSLSHKENWEISFSGKPCVLLEIMGSILKDERHQY